MKRTIDNFFVTSDLCEVHSQCSDTEPSTSERLKSTSVSRKHITCRDKCPAQVPPLPTAFQQQAAGNRSSEEAKIMIKFNIVYNIAKECQSTLSTSTISVTYLSCRTVLQIKNFVSTSLLVHHLQINIVCMTAIKIK